MPPKACADDLVVARLVLHPAYLAKSFFPKLLLDQVGLSSVGSRTRRIQPRRQTQKKAPPEMETTELFVSGTRAAMGNFPAFARSLNEQMPVAEQFARIETFAAMTPADRLHLEGTNVGHVFEVGLHLPPEGDASDVRALFADYAKDCGFRVNGEFEFEAGRLLFVAVEGDATGLENLAQFTLTRVVRPMPHLRAARPVTRSMPLAVSFSLPSGEPLSREPKVAILSAVETVNPKIQSTLDAAALCKMADRRQITGGVLDGPLAFDNAISAEAARIKGIASPVAGQADILMVPDLEAGNMLAKQLEYLAGAASCGVVLGARVPIALTSRADTAASRMASAALAMLAARGPQA